MTTKLHSLLFFVYLFLVTSSLNVNLRISEGLSMDTQLDEANGCRISLKKTPHVHENEQMTYMTQIQDSLGDFKNCKLIKS